MYDAEQPQVDSSSQSAFIPQMML